MEIEISILLLSTQSVQYLNQETRERDREAQMVLCYSIWQKLTTTTRLQESVYILTNLGQLPFTLFTKIA